MDIMKGNPVVTKIYFYLETEQGINKEFRKQFTWFLSFKLYWKGNSVSIIGCDQHNITRDCGLFSITNVTDLALKGDPGTLRVVTRAANAFQCILLCGICMYPRNWTGFPTIDLFSEHGERGDKNRGEIHSTSSRCAACKFNIVEGLMTFSNEHTKLHRNSDTKNRQQRTTTKLPLDLLLHIYHASDFLKLLR